MLSLIFGFFSDLFYILVFIAMCAGICASLMGIVARLIPFLGTYALIFQIVGFVLTLGGSYYVGDHKGYNRRVAEDQIEIERLNGQARAKEVELDKQKQATSVALRKAKDAITQKQSDIDKRIDSGELRLPSSCGVQTNADARVTSGSGSSGQGESDRQTIRDIVQIASEGDKAITERNACIDFYNSVRSKVNEVEK